MKKNSSNPTTSQQMTPSEVLFGGIMATASLWAIWCTVSLLFVSMQ
ncbi:MAG: hypothetical protein AB1568_10610 [Thermodesulfobacteriota bacterium]